MSAPKPPPLPAGPKIPRPPRLPSDFSSKPPVSRPLTKLSAKKNSSFPPEPVTTPNTLQFRSSEMVKNWAQSLPEHRVVLERMARHYATLAKKKRQPSKDK